MVRQILLCGEGDGFSLQHSWEMNLLGTVWSGRIRFSLKYYSRLDLEKLQKVPGTVLAGEDRR